MFQKMAFKGPVGTAEIGWSSNSSEEVERRTAEEALLGASVIRYCGKKFRAGAFSFLVLVSERTAL